MSIRIKQQFYNHAVKLGIDLANLEVENLDFSQPIKTKSSFKKNAAEIKKIYNYKFPQIIKPKIVDFGFFTVEFEKKLSQ